MEKSAIQILLRSSLFSYAATAVFLLLLAFGMYRFQWGEKEITLGVRGIYILACFLAGLSAGKKAKRRRFLWGFCAGALYFLIFLALSSMLPLITHTFKLGVNLLASFSQFKVRELGHTTNEGFAFSLFSFT